MSDKKKMQLGMNFSTASGRLRKDVLFMLATKCDMNICHQCNKRIETASELSIEHINPWLDSEKPIELFFDLDNIAFSHLSCNSRAGRKRTSPFTKGELREKHRIYQKERYCPEQRAKRWKDKGH